MRIAVAGRPTAAKIAVCVRSAARNRPVAHPAWYLPPGAPDLVMCPLWVLQA